MDAAILTMILVGGLILFATRWVSMEITALLIVAALALTGILEPGEALQGFSSTATVTVAAMFVISPSACSRARLLRRIASARLLASSKLKGSSAPVSAGNRSLFSS